MPDRSPVTDHGNREDAARRHYFAFLAEGRCFLVTTFRPKGAPVSVRVQGIVDGDGAYFRIRSRSGTARYLRQAVPVQVTGCDALGLVSYGQPRFAAVRLLEDEEASRAGEKLARRYPARRRFLTRLLPRTWVHYELVVP